LTNSLSPAQSITKANKLGNAEEYLLPTPQGKRWELARSDEFDGTKIDRNKPHIPGDWKRPIQ